MQFVNTLRLVEEDEDDALSKSSVRERVIFFCLWLPNPKECRDLVRPPPSADADGDRAVVDAVVACWLFPLASVPPCVVSGGVRLRFGGCTRGSLWRLEAKLSDGARNRLRRFPVLPELELVLEGEEVWTPFPTPPDEGEDGRDSCFLLLLRRKMGRRETSVERRGADSPI